MNKIFSKIATSILSVGIFAVGASSVYADVPGRYLTADLSSADLLGVIASHPILFWGILVALVVVCVCYGVFLLFRKK